MEQKTVDISILQMSSIIGNVEENIKKAKDLIENELNPETDILVLPEVWTCGWSFRYRISFTNRKKVQY